MALRPTCIKNIKFKIIKINQSYLHPSQLKPSLIWRMQAKSCRYSKYLKWFLCICWKKHGQQNNSSPKLQDPHCKNELWVLILFTWNISWRNHAHHRHTHRKKGTRQNDILFVLLLRYNCDWGTLSFSKMLNIGSYDFVAADKFGKKWLDSFLAPYPRIWLLFGSFLDKIWPFGKM